MANAPALRHLARIDVTANLLPDSEVRCLRWALPDAQSDPDDVDE